MIIKDRLTHLNKYSVHLALPLIFVFLSACSSSGGSASCDTVASTVAATAFFRVENNLSSGLSWTLPAFAFGADMKPGECTIVGVEPSQYTVELQQCNIGSEACTSDIGSEKLIVFSVAQGDTFTLIVDSNTFK